MLTRRPSVRLEVRPIAASRARATFAQDVAAGLRSSPRRLPSKYLYDDVGSALFAAIMVLPEYYLTRAETQILRECGWEIVRALGNPVEFIELGSGSAVKTRILIEEALRAQGSLTYSPIDISQEALRESASALADSYEQLRVIAYAGDYFDVLGSPALHRDGHVLVMFMGSNIGNYEPREAQKLLRGIAASLKAGDGLLLGTDMKKDAAQIRLAYDDPAGVTAAFNKNLLARINRELRADFPLDAFAHVAEYDERDGGVRSYLQAQRSVTATIGDLDLRVAFEQGERVQTESSYKFSPADVEAMASAAGLRLKQWWTDEPLHRFRVNLLVRE